MQEVIYGELIDKGSYGKVYKCTVSGQEMAVKIISLERDGLLSPLEISIMSTYKHPYLGDAEYISIESNDVYIFQSLAICNLRQYLNNYEVSVDLVTVWLYQLSTAMDCLHRNNITHCDIKSDNILVYTNSILKLTDFTLSRLKISSGTSYSGHLGSLYWRAPEVMTGKSWDEKSDIWSMGSVFYHIITNQLLVPLQKADIETDIIVDKKAKEQELILLSVGSWCVSMGETINTFIVGNRPFIPIKLSHKFNRVSNEIRNLIINMLKYNPLYRPTSTQIMRSISTRNTDYRIISARKPSIKQIDSTELTKYYLSVGCSDINLVKLASEIYVRAKNVLNSLVKADASLSIANKIVYGKRYERSKYDAKDILNTEILICKDLSYKLHFTSNDDEIITSIPRIRDTL